MYFQVVTIEHSLEKPQAELGDATLSPVFRRVSARCPVLHLFGYVHLPLQEAPLRFATLPARSSSSLPAPAPAPADAAKINRGAMQHRCGASVPPRPPLAVEQLPVATLLAPLPRATSWHRATGDEASALMHGALASPVPKQTARTVHISVDTPEPTQRVMEEKKERGQAAAPPLPFGGSLKAHRPEASCSTSGVPLTADTLRSSTVCRLRYTQRRACLHVHGVYPSILLPQYDRDVSAEQLAAQLETVALRVLSRQNTVVPGQQLVHDVRLVHRYNVYGYRPHGYAFYEVELLDPSMTPKVVDILQNTREVGGRQWQLYDAHNKYHTQFMVRWRVNGVAPFELPVPRCHVRLPTAPEPSDTIGLSAAFLASHSHLPDSSVQQDRVHSGTPCFTSQDFLKCWRSDELGRLTTAEVEMDVKAADLLSGDAQEAEEEPQPPDDQHHSPPPLPLRTTKRRKTVTAGDNLSYTRRIIRQYFKEHGVPDALRVADTIAMERHVQAKAPTSSGLSAAGSRILLRYGNVAQIQRADPTVKWMRHRMLEYLAQRRAAAAEAAEHRAATSTSAQQLLWKTEVAIHGEEDPATVDEDTEEKVLDVKPTKDAAATTMDVSSDAPTVAQQQEQQDIRQRLVADYSKPSGGSGAGSSSRATGGFRTRRTGRAAEAPAKAPRPTFAAMLAAKNNQEEFDAKGVKGDAVYVGFSSDSLQVSQSQSVGVGQPPPPVPPLQEDDRTDGTCKAEPSNLSPSWSSFLTLGVQEEAKMQATQDLMAALQTRSSTHVSFLPEAPQAMESKERRGNGVDSEPRQGDTVRASKPTATEHTSQVSPLPLQTEETVSPAEPPDSVRTTPPCQDSPPAERRAALSSSWSSWSSVSSTKSTEDSASASAAAADTFVGGTERQPPQLLGPKRQASRDRRDASLVAEEGGVSKRHNGEREADSQRTYRDEPTQRLTVKSAHSTPSPNTGNVDADNRVGATSASFHAQADTPYWHRKNSGDGDTSPVAGLAAHSLTDNPNATHTSGGKDDTVHARASLHKRLRFSDHVSSLTVAPSAPLSSFPYTVGDCIALVRVRTPPPRAAPSPFVRSHEATACDVLAVARIAGYDAAAVKLQWFVTLQETHLASEEATLVRRGSWLRMPQVVCAPSATGASRRKGIGPSAVHSRAFHPAHTPEEEDVLLGEMLLSDVCDSVPVSVLKEASETTASRTTLVYALAISTPTQRLPSHSGVDSFDTRPATVKNEAGGGHTDERITSDAEVRVWRLQCCVDAAAYGAEDAEFSLRYAPSEQHVCRRRHVPASRWPLLRILCRYQYLMEARVFTKLPPDLFSRDTYRDAASSTSRHSADGPSTQGSIKSTPHPQTQKNSAQDGARGSSSAVVPPRHTSSCVLFTQPQQLLCSVKGEGDSLGDESERGSSLRTRPAAEEPSATSSFFSTSSSSEWRSTEEEDEEEAAEELRRKTPRLVDTRLKESLPQAPAASSPTAGDTNADGGEVEGEGEDTLLFPSSSEASDDTASGTSSDEEHRSAEWELLGSSRQPSDVQCHSSLPQPSASRSLSRSARSPHAVATPTRSHNPSYRVSTNAMPVQDIQVGAYRIPRSVHTVTRHTAHTILSKEQQRWRRRGSATDVSFVDSSEVHEPEDEEHRESLAPLLTLSRTGFDPGTTQSHDEEDSESIGRQSAALGVSAAPPDRGDDGGSKAASAWADAEVLNAFSSSSESAASSSSSVLASAANRDGEVPNRFEDVSASLSVESLAASQASSVEALRVVTAAQRCFLQTLQAERNDTADRRDGSPPASVVFQTRGSLGPAVDGVPRWFQLTALRERNDGEAEQREHGAATLQSTTASSSHAARVVKDKSRGATTDANVDVRVSAVTWPHMPSTLESTDTERERPRYEQVAATAVLNTSTSSLSSMAKVPHQLLPAAAAAPPTSTHSTPSASRPKKEEKKSASRVSGLSLSMTQQPQHYLQCVLRVLYIEVLLHRRPHDAYVSASEVLAVGLGQATTATDSAIGIRVFCVAPVSTHKKQSGTASTNTNTNTNATGKEELSNKADSSHPSTGTDILAGVPAQGLCGPVNVVTAKDEAALLHAVREEILSYDPDILLSWEGCKYGLGYLATRYRAVLHRSLAADLSRMTQFHGYKRPTTTTTTAAAAGAAGDGGDAGSRPRSCSHARNTRKFDVPGTSSALDTATKDATSADSGSPLNHLASVSSRQDEIVDAGAADVASPASSTPADDAPQATEPFAEPEEDDLDDDEDPADDERTEVHGVQNNSAKWEWSRTGSWLGRQQQHQEAHTATAAVDSTAASYAKRFGANVRITGRVCTSLGRDLRKDVKMPSYSLPMVHQELFGQPLPYFADTYLSELYVSSSVSGHDPGERHAALRYLVARVAAPHRIACKLHWFTKLLEFSRMYGILTEEVLTRGSQFRVEATLLRLAYPLHYTMLSPSLAQVHRQPRIECIPLVLQPRADLYRQADPIVVLDFRSLYPSVIIAYNLCYTTCLGMVQPTARGRLGVLSDFKQSDPVLAELLPDDGAQHDGVVFTPNGAMFVAPSTRHGLLPQMVQAVLDTRFEVQASLEHIAVPSGDTVMQQRLQEQQLALKMLANVTYGYTGASYSGRMPCVDLAEAIVSLGRQTLERAVALIHSTTAWRAEVVYGDTDSLFVRLSGRSLKEAFVVGQQMADAVTQSNPPPIRLQFEKVLSPCLLLVKKRYAGYMWTSPAQATPTFLAKGIEVVRRDQCPITAHLADRLLRLLFDGATTAVLKHVYYDKVEKLQAGAVNPRQCVFRRSVKLGRYGRSGDSHLPLAARMALQEMERDVTQTPYWGERVPYVVVRSLHSIGKLSDQVLHPQQLLYRTDTHALDAAYYVARNVNSTLDRMFYLVGISFAQWYQAMPRRRTAHSALLNVPTFMKTQAAAAAAMAGSGGITRPPSAPLMPTALPLRLPQSLLESSAARAEYIKTHMSRLWREATDPLFAARCAEARRVAEEVISEDDERESDDEALARDHRGMQQYNQIIHTPMTEDLTRPTVREVVDVEQLMATQRARVPASATAASPLVTAAAKATAWIPPRATPLSNGNNVRRRGRPPGSKNKRRVRSVTLDSFYPRTLCVVCEAETVSLEDVRRQREILRPLVRPLIQQDEDRKTGAATMQKPRASPKNGRYTGAVEKNDVQPPLTCSTSSSSVLLTPPICTKCWCDPASLYLRVQERCRTVGRATDALHGLCALCVTSGGDAGSAARSTFRTALADMEDMDKFSADALRAARAVQEPARSYAMGGAPRHLLGAVELSSCGVPRGCVSIDCAVGFQKKWVAAQWQQWRHVQKFLNDVL